MQIWGGGILWRAADDRNYYLVRANPLEQNIRIYRVVNGVRHLLQNFDQIIDVKRWHTLRVISQGCRSRVLFDEKEVFDLCDQTFSKGRIGLWTKYDAVTYFDDLQMQVLPELSDVQSHHIERPFIVPPVGRSLGNAIS